LETISLILHEDIHSLLHLHEDMEIFECEGDGDVISIQHW